MKLKDTNIIDKDKQEVNLEDLQFDAAGKFWYTHAGHEISPDELLAYAMKLETVVTGLQLQITALREILKIAERLLDHADFKNGNTDPGGLIDEGEVHAARVYNGMQALKESIDG